MKAISIVGYKDSGKTTLTSTLADALDSKGHTVAIAKFTHHGLDKSETDTGRFAKGKRTVIGLGPEEAAIRWGDKRYLIDMLPLVEADFLLVEGGKSLGWLPRILCLRTPEENNELNRGLAVATYGDVEAPDLPAFAPSSLDALVALVEAQAFMLPGLDCGACGEEDCATLCARIVAGDATLKDCLSVDEEGFNISINGQHVGMNPFVERIISSSIKGMLAELKGYVPGGDVVIKMKS